MCRSCIQPSRLYDDEIEFTIKIKCGTETMTCRKKGAKNNKYPTNLLIYHSAPSVSLKLQFLTKLKCIYNNCIYVKCVLEFIKKVCLKSYTVNKIK